MLLTTKFYPPPLPEYFLVRPAIDFDQLLTHPLTVLQAPGGYGKSLAMSHWLQHSDVRYSWLSLDRRDNQWNHFWRYFIAALQRIDDDFLADIFNTLQKGENLDADVLVTALCNTILQWSEPTVLVLDDFHHLDDARILESLNYCLDYLPAHFHLMVISRTQPALQLAKRRIKGHVFELGCQQLAFKTEETQDLLQRGFALSLTPALLDRLQNDTEGWVAGVQMAAISLQKQPDKASWLEREHWGRNIDKFLFAEVLQSVSLEQQQFLLQCSCLPRLQADLCDAILFHDGSRVMLENCVAQGLFIIPLDNDDTWFRFHDLFREFLYRQFLNQGVEKVRHLEYRAAHWLGSHEAVDDAMELVERSQSVHRKIEFIEQYGGYYRQRGEREALYQLLRKIPSDQLTERPKLLIFLVWALPTTERGNYLVQSLETAIKLLQKLRDGQGSQRDETVELGFSSQQDVLQFHCEALAQLAYVCLLAGRCQDAERHASEVIAIAGDQQVGFSLMAHMELAKAQFFTQKYRLALQSIDVVVEGGMAIGQVEMVLAGMFYRNRILYEMGELNAMSISHQQLLDWIKSQGHWQHPLAAFHMGLLVDSFRERGKFDQAQECLSKLEKNARDTSASLAMMEFFICHEKLKLFWSQRNWSKVHEQLQTISAMSLQLGTSHDFGYFPLVVWRLRLAIVEKRWVDAELAVSNVDNSFEGQLAVVSASLAMGRFSAAQTLLTGLQQSPPLESRPKQFRVMFLTRLLSWLAESNEFNLAALSELLHDVEKAGYHQLILDEGVGIAVFEQALLAIQNSHLHTQYIGFLLEQWRLAQQVNTAADDESYRSLTTQELSAEAQNTLQQLALDPLTPRELDIMRSIYCGKKNAEIAQILDLTVGTVKWHITNIYAKLGVKNRGQALVRVREIDLFK